jgi:general nucleoside transport system ATP-binding protein
VSSLRSEADRRDCKAVGHLAGSNDKQKQRVMPAALELRQIRKSFDGFLALNNADFTAMRGEVHALLGENGAGKSSLMNVAAGLYAADAGDMLVDGAPVRLSGPSAAAAHRIGMVHQHFKLVKPFTVAENVLLANKRSSFASGLREIEGEIRRHSNSLGFAIDPDRRVDSLSIAEQQRVEIIKVLVAGAEILILDEPTAVLTDDEAERLLTTAREIARRGAAVILVTHKLSDVKTFADRVTVMRAGSAVATVDPRAVSAAELTTLIVGTSIAPPPRQGGVPGPLRLNVAKLRCARSDGHVMVSDLSFAVHGGEIYGIAGVGGNGQSELAETFMGIREPLAGAIEIEEGGQFVIASPGDYRDLGVGSIPADRYSYGLATSLPIADNFAIGQVHTGRYGTWLHVDRKTMRTAAEAAIRDFDVQGVRRLRQKAGLLSGGNAQKLVIAREFSRNPTVIVAHSPSRGLDVRATAAVHGRLLGARAAGAAVVLISDDLDEVLTLADRVGVMTRGRIIAEFAAPADRQAVGKAMVDHA